MIDVGHKPSTLRCATARAVLTAAPETLAAIRERRVPKGDPIDGGGRGGHGAGCHP